MVKLVKELLSKFLLDVSFTTNKKSSKLMKKLRKFDLCDVSSQKVRDISKC